ncbi:MAG TPA: cytochrome ubiquinol oxidase subunit I [Thermoplasmata archaeon]|nr:cytochrome ubiquinol oxidase subunit I [Thermoplasmata archaeon]
MGVPILEFDRFLFAFTIASHILIVSVSIGLALVISACEFLSARYGDPLYQGLARKLCRPFVVSFGVGTGSGIVMAVELVNLFPGFMKLVSETGVIAIFYVEIFAFFLETIFLVVYVYYGKFFVGKYSRWALTVPVVLGTLLSAVLIVMVNAWMNTPNGFDLAQYQLNGAVTGVNPWAPFFTASTGYEVMHVVAAVPLTGLMLIGGYFAYRYHRGTDPTERKLFLRGLRIATVVGVVLVALSVLAGALEIESLYKYQPLKYAAIELNPTPGTNLPETIFGTLSGTTVVGAIQIPGLQGLLTHHEMLPGLSQCSSTSPCPPLIIHTTFDVMVLGGALIGLFLLAFAALWAAGRRPYERRLWVYGLAAVSVLTAVVMELGWATDEIGRQPWIVYNVMTVSAAASSSNGLVVPGVIIVAFYAALVPATFYFMVRVFNGRPLEVDLEPARAGKDVNY